jgi:organic radical activating enzyme
MLNGGWPERGNGCEYCRDTEDAGGMSDRKTNLTLIETNQEFQELIPPELLVNPTALEVSPTMLEVYFTNRCNMSCIYCGPNYSTLWVAENKRYGTPDHHSSSVNWVSAESLDRQYPDRLKQFWQWLEAHSDSLRMFHVLGGEPFYQSETEETIRFWHDHPNPRLHLKIFSNLKVDKDKLRYLMCELKRLYEGKRCKSVGIIASLDCWGPQQEYVRSGLDLRDWTECYEYLIYEHPWANISINSTINALSLKTMPELIRRVRAWDTTRTRILGDAKDVQQLSLVFNMLLGPPFMNAGIFPAGFFDSEFQEIVALLPNRSDWERANVEYMKGIWKTVNATPHDSTLIASLKRFLDEIDRRRQKNWRSTFQWLVNAS